MRKRKNTTGRSGNIKAYIRDQRKLVFWCEVEVARDGRLSNSAFGTYCKLLSLPKNWRLTTNQTPRFLNLSKNTFKAHLVELIELGYIVKTRVNEKTNAYEYQIVEPQTSKVFNPTNLYNYSIQQLDFYYKDKRTQDKWKPIIKKVFKAKAELETKLKEQYEELLRDFDPTDIDLLSDNDPF